MKVRKAVTDVSQQRAPWLLLTFSLPAKQASERVDIWRKLKRYGALSLRTSGYLLPNSAENLEHFQWLATSVRNHSGEASLAQVQSLDDHSHDDLQKLFVDARSRDYDTLAQHLRKALKQKGRTSADWVRFRRRLQEIIAIDFFNSPMRGRVENLLATATAAQNASRTTADLQTKFLKKEYHNRIWVTRPRPGIDRVSSAWLIVHFIDAKAQFTFATDSHRKPDAISFDMFQEGGFGHVGDDCSFETLCKRFRVSDPKVKILAEMIHDADLDDAKFGRVEAIGIDRILIGWAKQGLTDDELLRRGMELIDGLYQAVT
jgi:hypothetical protein